MPPLIELGAADGNPVPIDDGRLTKIWIVDIGVGAVRHDFLPVLQWNNVAADKRFHRAGTENLLKAEALEKGSRTKSVTAIGGISRIALVGCASTSCPGQRNRDDGLVADLVRQRAVATGIGNTIAS